MKVGIFVVTFNQPEYFDRCCDSIVRNTSYIDYELYTHNNSEENEGINICFNRMIKKTKCDLIVMMNDDVVVTQGWLDALVKGVEVNGYAGVGPKTNDCEGPQRIHDLPKDITNDEIEEYGKTFDGRFVKEIHLLNGFCWAITREAYDRVNGLNERIGLCGHETEMCHKMRKFGYRFGMVNTYVHHFRGVSIRKAEKDGNYDRAKDIKLGEEICSKY